MTRRQALLAVLSAQAVLPTVQWSELSQFSGSPFARIVLGGARGLAKLVIEGPNGEELTFSAQELFDELKGGRG